MNLIKNIPVSSFMTRETICIQEDALLIDAANQFRPETFHHLPVVNKEAKLVGILSDRDVKQLQHHFTLLGLDKALEANTEFMSSLLVKEVMHKNPIFLDPDAPISDAIEILLTENINSVIISKNDEVLGILTTYDILKRIVDPALVD